QATWATIERMCTASLKSSHEIHTKLARRRPVLPRAFTNNTSNACTDQNISALAAMFDTWLDERMEIVTSQLAKPYECNIACIQRVQSIEWLRWSTPKMVIERPLLNL